MRTKKTIKEKWSKLLRKTPLRKISPEKALWMRLYREKKKLDHAFQNCCRCSQGDVIQRLERHHHSGRHNHWLLEYCWLCKSCHKWVHDNAREARELGYLQPPHWGQPHDPELPKPWIKDIVK